MQKLATVGQDPNRLIDCSDVIPVPTGTVADPFLPAGITTDDIQAACSSTPFPTVSVLGGESLGRVSQLILSDISSSGAETTIPAL